MDTVRQRFGPSTQIQHSTQGTPKPIASIASAGLDKKASSPGLDSGTEGTVAIAGIDWFAGPSGPDNQAEASEENTEGFILLAQYER